MRFFSNETGNATAGLLIIGGGLFAGVHALDQGIALNNLHSEKRHQAELTVVEQNILSASAIAKSLICGNQVQVSDKSFSKDGSNFITNRGKMFVSLAVPGKSSSYDAVFKDQTPRMETTAVAFSILRNNLPDSIVVAATSKLADQRKNQNLKIDCSSTTSSSSSTPTETDTNFTTTIALGIGFEDGHDQDFNDIVMCIEGQFAVDVTKNEIVSLKNQEIEFFFKRLTGQKDHILRLFEDEIGKNKMVEIRDLSFGQEVEREFNLKKGQVIKLALGDRRHRSLALSKGIDHSWAKVEKDNCRNVGD